METILMKSKDLKTKKYLEFEKRVSALKAKGVTPKLAVIQVGNDDASNIYIKYKRLAAEKLGIDFEKVTLEEDVTFNELKNVVEKFNSDSETDGIIIQFPLPKQFSKREVSALVLPNKDADGGHPFNHGVNFTRQNTYAPEPCTPKGVMELLDFYHIDIEGKSAVVIGRSNIAGRPMSYMLSNRNATVSLLHSKTSDDVKRSIIKNADIIVSATGHKDVVTVDMVKDGVVIVDIGIIRDQGKLRGDLDFEKFIGKAKAITPVPGGVGPMTVTLLMENVIGLAEKNRG